MTNTTNPRATVAGLFVKRAHGMPLIGTHWSKRAAERGAGNNTTVGGGIHPGETPEVAMRRELGEEYGEGVAARCLMWQLYMEPMQAQSSSGVIKQYYWFLILCPSDIETPDINPAEIRSFGWQPMNAIEAALLCFTPSKQQMLLAALRQAAKVHPDIIPYNMLPAAA